mmetsp:Transcript_54938/g.117913  ORF Transcript_54938/g.117913 Transcript_54938/m.117913 type:complete len:660 (+) Transcript_54938:87-2066(+)
MSTSAVVLVALASAVSVSTGFDVAAQRPSEGTWRRTQCGGPSGTAEIATPWADEVSPKKTPLPAYPRPQMVRGSGADFAALRDAGDTSVWANLNGLWEWQEAGAEKPPFGQSLNRSILVPFPVESCLSGVAPQRSADVAKSMWYRLVFDVAVQSDRTLLHFGAVDWQTAVYFNGARLGQHNGGYDGFSFDVTDHLTAHGKGNELLLYVFDPSDTGNQPHGKQRISAIDKPGGDTYTPSSGIWQTVWLERVPESYIRALTIDQASTSHVAVTADIFAANGGTEVYVKVLDGGREIVSVRGFAGERITFKVPSPKLWSPDAPYLYDLRVTTESDAVLAYFGLRTFTLGNVESTSQGGGGGTTKPLLNGKFTFLAGFLDQSWWPDGQYTAPTDEALEFDLAATKMFGLNMIRLHQKVNPERWYYHADRLGLVLFQDMVQKYGHATDKLVSLFVADLQAMIKGRGNHPCIVQWTTFNEGDCWSVFKTKPLDVEGITKLAKQLDPTRLVDTDSGGGANDFGYADVNDIHSYPYPGNPNASATQYAMVGEFGGIGAFIKGKEWVPGKCHTYLKVDTAAEEAAAYVSMAKTIESRVDHVSASVYTQTTDVELECDGFLNYDRSNKFSDEDTKAIHDANLAIISASQRISSLPASGGSSVAFTEQYV